jgi:hypothetical protein
MIEIAENLPHYARFDKIRNTIVLDIEVLNRIPAEDLLPALIIIISHEGDHPGRNEKAVTTLDAIRFVKWSEGHRQSVKDALDLLGADKAYIKALETALIVANALKALMKLGRAGPQSTDNTQSQRKQPSPALPAGASSTQNATGRVLGNGSTALPIWQGLVNGFRLGQTGKYINTEIFLKTIGATPRALSPGIIIATTISAIVGRGFPTNAQEFKEFVGLLKYGLGAVVGLEGTGEASATEDAEDVVSAKKQDASKEDASEESEGAQSLTNNSGKKLGNEESVTKEPAKPEGSICLSSQNTSLTNGLPHEIMKPIIKRLFGEKAMKLPGEEKYKEVNTPIADLIHNKNKNAEPTPSQWKEIEDEARFLERKFGAAPDRHIADAKERVMEKADWAEAEKITVKIISFLLNGLEVELTQDEEDILREASSKVLQKAQTFVGFLKTLSPEEQKQWKHEIYEHLRYEDFEKILFSENWEEVVDLLPKSLAEKFRELRKKYEEEKKKAEEAEEEKRKVEKFFKDRGITNCATGFAPTIIKDALIKAMEAAKEWTVKVFVDTFNKLTEEYKIKCLGLTVERFKEFMEKELPVNVLEIIEKNIRLHFVGVLNFGEDEFIEAYQINGGTELKRQVYLDRLVKINGKIFVMTYEKNLKDVVIAENELLSDVEIDSIKGKVEGVGSRDGISGTNNVGTQPFMSQGREEITSNTNEGGEVDSEVSRGNEGEIPDEAGQGGLGNVPGKSKFLSFKR